MGLVDVAAQADYLAAKEEHLAAFKKWERREHAAQRQSGYDAAQAAGFGAGALATEAIEELHDTLPQSLIGLFAKARVAHVTDSDQLAKQLVWDMDILARLSIAPLQS